MYHVLSMDVETLCYNAIDSGSAYSLSKHVNWL